MIDTSGIDWSKRRPAFGQGHMAATGIALEHFEYGLARVRMPYRPELLGDPERGFIHTSAVMSLVDSACGFPALALIPASEIIVTLDLRMDYLRPSLAPYDLVCEVDCYRMTAQIAFVRAIVWQQDQGTPVANAVATFMRVPEPSGGA